ncbi:fimbrillin family protein [Bacteroidales bacterium SW292]|nr:fimbrillin family protein [Bacteroidales bacterium SW292]
MSNFKFLVMMKSKYLLVTALSAAALTACNNDEVLEVNQGRGISFQVATEAATRAAATTTNSIDEFMVWGFTEEEPAKTLMDDLSVSKTGSDWTYTGTIFWPAAPVNFYSISPEPVSDKVSEGTVSITSNEQKITGFTVNTDQNQQVDLLYAVNKGENKDDHESKPVSINFRHALSQIVFKAKNTNENLKVIVKGVKIANIKKAGDFTYPSQSTTTQYTSGSSSIVATTQGEWDNVTTEQTFAAGMSGEVTLNGKDETALDLTSKEDEVYTGALFMIPQALTPWDPKAIGALNTTNKGVYFLVDCQILSGTNKNIQVWPSDPKEQYAEVAIPASKLNWEQGKKYIYTFTFDKGGGYVPGPDPNPDPTLIGIDFDVTVDEFINGGEQDIDMETGKE